MLTVVHSIASLDPSKGGTSRSVSKLCEYMARAGASISVVAGYGEAGREAIASNPTPGFEVTLVRTVKIPVLGLEYAAGFSTALEKVINSKKPHCLQDHGIWLHTNHAAANICRRLNIPRVLSLHGMLLPAARNRRKWRKRLAWHTYQRFDVESAALLRATSEEEYLAIRELGLKCPVVIVPNGIEMPQPRATMPELDQFGRRTAAFVGRIHPIKGLAKLISAWGIARPAQWRLVIAGPSEAGYQQTLMSQVQAEGLEDTIQFSGPLDESRKWNLLRSSHLFVLPSESENFSLALVEALAVGVPAIASRGTPWSMLPRLGCGWWVDNDPLSLANTLREVTQLKDIELFEMGARGAIFAHREYAIERIATDMLAAYEWLIGGGPPRVPTFL